MDIDPPVPPPSSAPKKSKKFTPKAPSRRKTGPLLPKNDDDVEADPELLRRIHERHGTRRPKLEKKSSVNVAMSLGAGSSSSIPLKPKDESSKNSPNLRETAQKSIVISNSLCKTDGDADEMLVDDKFKSLSKPKKKYRERWDPHSYYPITLPWRPLGSGDPEILNEHEFREEKEYDENSDESRIINHMVP